MDEKTSQKLKFITIPGEILYHSGLSLAEKMFLGLVSGFSPNPLMMANSDLASALGLCQGHVSRLIHRLARAGWIVVEGEQSRWRKIYFVENSKVQEAVTLAPAQTTLAPAQTTLAPAQTTVLKQQSISDSTLAPAQSTLPLAQTTLAPAQSTLAPARTIIEYNIKENNISLSREDSFSLSQVPDNGSPSEDAGTAAPSETFTLAQVQETIAQHGLEVDAQRFYEYYRGQRLSRFALYLKLKSWHTNRSIPPPPRRKTAAELVAEYEAQQAQYASLMNTQA